jgi:hypothetical protein
MMRVVRIWLPAAIALAGIVLIAVRPNEDGLEGGTMVVAAGISVWLLNLLYRIGVSGDREREQEDLARSYYDEHGRWPDEEPPPRAPGPQPAPPGPRPDPHPRAGARGPVHQHRRRG